MKLILRHNRTFEEYFYLVCSEPKFLYFEFDKRRRMDKYV